MRSMPRTVGDISVSDVTNGKIMGVSIKEHMNSKPLYSDIRRCIRKLKHLLTQLEIRSIGIVRDLAVLSLSEWSLLVEQCNKEFGGMEISVVFFKNNLPVPKVEDRYRIIKEYHE